MKTFRQGLIATIKRPDFTLSLVTLSVVAVITGPFGTYTEVPLATRALYMPPMVIFGAFLMAAVEAAVHSQFSTKTVIQRGAMVAGAMAVLAGPVVCVISNAATVGMREPRRFAHVFLIVLGLAFFFYCVRHMGHEKPMPAVQTAPDRLTELLELEAGMVLLAVSADDHYVRVLTDQGEHRVLLRFSDALRELRDHDGVQVHRSHWVSRSSAARIGKKGQNHRLYLINGRDVPVSRTKLETVRSALKLDLAL